jgi:hypothetical protein
VNIKGPANNTYTTNLTLNFAYNVSFGGMIVSCALVINGTDAAIEPSITKDATQSFLYTFSGDGEYEWNVRCEGEDGRSSLGDGVSDVGANRTLSIDSLAPNITLVSPADLETITTSAATFIYQADDNYAVGNCTLYVDEAPIETRASIAGGANQSVQYILDNGLHPWYVRCYDRAGNSALSATRTLNVSSSATSGTQFFETNSLPGSVGINVDVICMSGP